VVRLEESTYASIRKSLEMGGELHIGGGTGCDICLQITTYVLYSSASHDWYLCEHHAREVGVLW